VKTLALVLGLLCTACGETPRARGRPSESGLPPSPRFDPPQNAVFTEDFSDAALTGWNPDRQGVWSVRDGVLRGRLPDQKQEVSFLRTGEPGWTDYAVDLDVCMTRGVDKGVAVRVQDRDAVAVDLRGSGYDDVLLHRGMTELGKAEVPNANGRWHHLRVEARGERFVVFVNGRPMVEGADRARTRGGIALVAYTGGSGICTVYYDNIVVTPLP
jgi:hypothetical protein